MSERPAPARPAAEQPGSREVDPGQQVEKTLAAYGFTRGGADLEPRGRIERFDAARRLAGEHPRLWHSLYDAGGIADTLRPPRARRFRAATSIAANFTTTRTRDGHEHTDTSAVVVTTRARRHLRRNRRVVRALYPRARVHVRVAGGRPWLARLLRPTGMRPRARRCSATRRPTRSSASDDPAPPGQPPREPALAGAAR